MRRGCGYSQVFTGRYRIGVWYQLTFYRRTIRAEAALAMTIRIILILAIAIIIVPSLAYGSTACMTESEARAKFPKEHLIWLGTNHCWTFGTVPVHSRPSLAEVPVPTPRPAIAAMPMSSSRPEIAAVPSSRPEIDIGGIDVTGAQCQYSPCE